MRFNFRTSLLPIALAFALAGCTDRDATNPAQNLTGCALLGTANISVTGGVIATMNSCTLFGISAGTSTAGPQLVLAFQSSNDGDPSHNMILTREGTRPGTGSYSAGTSTEQFAGLFTVNTEPSRTFTVASGSVNFTTSTATTLAGSLNLTGTEIVSSGTPAVVTISGTFSAKCSSTTNC